MPTQHPSHDQSSGGGSIAKALFFYFAAIVFFLVGAGSLMSGPSDDYSSRERFKDDNAYGATANAIEKIERKMGGSPAPVWFIAGLVCCLIVSVDNLRSPAGRR